MVALIYYKELLVHLPRGGPALFGPPGAPGEVERRLLVDPGR